MNVNILAEIAKYNCKSIDKKLYNKKFKFVDIKYFEEPILDVYLLSSIIYQQKTISKGEEWIERLRLCNRKLKFCIEIEWTLNCHQKRSHHNVTWMSVW